MKNFAIISTTFFFCLASALTAAPGDRVARLIDVTRVQRLASPLRPEIRTAADRGPVAPDVVVSGITVVLPPSPAQQAALDAFLEAQRDPASADYQHQLTPEEFAGRFGASENDIAKITAWLRNRGLTIDQIARGRNFIVISGGAAQVSAAFGTAIHQFESGGKLHYANTIAPAIPQALAGVVTEIRGLDDFRPAPMHLKTRILPNGFTPDYTSSSGTHYVAPDDVATIYDIAPLLNSGINGSGQKVAIMGQTDINLSDIQAFRSHFNLPANTPQVVLTGPDPGTSSGDLPEADLDLEWAGAVARNATIIYVNSRNVFTSAQYAIDQNLAPVISMSYGGCEIQNSSSLRSLAQQAVAQGITWIASSGDSGAAACDSSSASVATQGLAVNIPASFPEVTAIGGTTFAEGAGSYWTSTNTANLGSATSHIPEMAWNDTAARNELSATGGGVSRYYTKPAWQSGPGVPNDGMRDVPDISFSASPDHDGYLMYSGGSLMVVGGTSVPAPMFAGAVGLLNQYLLNNGKISKAGLGNINPTLYHIWQTSSGVFHDITSGNNIVPCTVGTTNCTTGSLGYSTTPGYDQVTGIGSADLNQLFGNWTGVVSSIGTTTVLTANPASVTQGASTQLTATVRPSSGTALPTGTVSFASGAKTLGTAALVASGSAATGSLTVSSSNLALGNNTVTATYAGNTSFGGSSASAVVTVTATTGNSVIVPSVSPNPVIKFSGSWTFTITLKDTSATPTTLTNFTVNGVSYAAYIPGFFGTSKIPANGSIAASLRMSGVTPPANQVFGFSGVDASGHQWTQTIVVPFD
jgi:subtilase family serine protease